MKFKTKLLLFLTNHMLLSFKYLILKKVFKLKKIQKKPQLDLKESVLLAFIDLVYEKGIESVTLQKVATKAGVAFGTVRYHYANEKESLTDSAISFVYNSGYKYIEAFSAEARKNADFNPVKNYVETMFTWTEKYPAQANMLMYYWFLCTGKNRTALVNSGYVDLAVQRLVSYIHEAIGMKIYKSTDSVNSKAAQIHAAIMGAGIVAMTMRDYQLKKQMCLDMVDLIMQQE